MARLQPCFFALRTGMRGGGKSSRMRPQVQCSHLIPRTYFKGFEDQIVIVLEIFVYINRKIHARWETSPLLVLRPRPPSHPQRLSFSHQTIYHCLPSFYFCSSDLEWPFYLCLLKLLLHIIHEVPEPLPSKQPSRTQKARISSFPVQIRNSRLPHLLLH